MKKPKTLLLLVVTVMLSGIISCKDSNPPEKDFWVAKVDSLEKENNHKDTQINDMMSFVGVLADGLDSIARQEDMLFAGSQGREGTGIDREQLKRNLEAFENMLNQQKQRIAQLADSLRSRGANLEKLTSLVNYLNQQLDEKNNVIRSLRADIDKKNVNIAQLQRRVSSLSESNTQLTKKVERQVEALDTQTEIINEGYVKIGTAKELKAQGILTGGFLKKKRVNVSTLRQDKFMKVDIRVSSDPKILTHMPPSSYRIVKNGKTSTLYVTDPTTFWSVSNFLIIQK